MGSISYSGSTFSKVVSVDINLGQGEILLKSEGQNPIRRFSIRRNSRIKLETPRDEECHIDKMKLECSRPILYLTGDVKHLTCTHSHVFVTGDVMKVEHGRVVAGDENTCTKEMSKALSSIKAQKGKEERFRLKGFFRSITLFAGQCNCELSGSFIDIITGGTICIDGNAGIIKAREVYCNRVSGYGLKLNLL